MLMLVGASTLLHSADDVEMSLIIKPNICIAPRGEKTCVSSMDIEWISSVTGDYCLYSKTSSIQPLFCWYAEQRGGFEDRVKLTEDLEYWMVTPDSPARLAVVVVKLAALKPHRQFPRRRNRLPWSITQ